MRHLTILLLTLAMLAACSSESNLVGENEATDQSAPGTVTDVDADLAAIHELQSAFHGALRNSDAEAFGSLWTDDAMLQVGDNSISGPEAIAEFIQSVPPFQNGWAALAPTYKTRIEIDGDRAEYGFECVYVPETGTLTGGEVVAHLHAIGTMRRVGDRWLFERFQGGVGPLP